MKKQKSILRRLYVMLSNRGVIWMDSQNCLILEWYSGNFQFRAGYNWVLIGTKAEEILFSIWSYCNDILKFIWYCLIGVNFWMSHIKHEPIVNVHYWIALDNIVYLFFQNLNFRHVALNLFRASSILWTCHVFGRISVTWNSFN